MGASGVWSKAEEVLLGAAAVATAAAVSVVLLAGAAPSAEIAPPAEIESAGCVTVAPPPVSPAAPPPLAPGATVVTFTIVDPVEVTCGR